MVGKLMSDLLDYSDATGAPGEVCRLIVARLLQKSSGPREGQRLSAEGAIIPTAATISST